MKIISTALTVGLLTISISSFAGTDKKSDVKNKRSVATDSTVRNMLCKEPFANLEAESRCKSHILDESIAQLYTTCITDELREKCKDSSGSNEENPTIANYIRDVICINSHVLECVDALKKMRSQTK